MTLRHKIVIFVIALLLAAAAVSMVSADTNSLLEFFGFGKPTETPTPAPETDNQPKAGETEVPEDDPFGEMDPALVEPDPQSVEAKASDSWFSDDWENDPYAYSYSAERFDENPEAAQQKNPGGPVPPYPPQRGPVNQPGRPRSFVDDPTPTPPVIFHRFQNPVFRPNCMLPCTGFPTGKPVEIKESVKYAQTNMSLSIPTLNISENIVLVPLVDDNFPVENLGSDIGLLEGSGPGRNDLFVLAGHNHLNTMEKGPFAGLSAINVSDLIFVRGAKNAARTFVVYANEKFAADDVDGLLSYARPGSIILITCEDESVAGGYLNRRVVFAEAKED